MPYWACVMLWYNDVVKWRILMYDIIVFENLRFRRSKRTRKPGKPAFSKICTLESVFEKMCFRWPFQYIYFFFYSFVYIFIALPQASVCRFIFSTSYILYWSRSITGWSGTTQRFVAVDLTIFNSIFWYVKPLSCRFNHLNLFISFSCILQDTPDSYCFSPNIAK